MKAPAERFAWLPALLVGATAGVTAEVAMGMLLYAGPGFVRSLTTVLAVEGAALAGGLWTAPAPGPGLIDRLRRRWLLCLTSLLAAAAFGTAWSAVPGLGAEPVGQGFGLALLAGLPLYACGAVLGGMASVASSDPLGARSGPGPASALGAALGFVATGLLLPRAPIPASLLVGCLVMLSAGGMVYGIVLAGRLHIHVRATRPSAVGEVRVEDRRLTRTSLAARYLVEGDHVRRRASLGEESEVAWDVAVARALMPSSDRDWRVLVVGGGVSTLPKALVEEHPGAAVEVLERTGAVVELGRDHFGTGLQPGANDRINLRVGNLEDLVHDVSGHFDLVVVDTAALGPLGGLPSLSRSARGALVGALDESGLMAWGPVASETESTAFGEGWDHRLLRRRLHGADEAVLLSRRGPLPETGPIADFSPVNGSRPQP